MTFDHERLLIKVTTFNVFYLTNGASFDHNLYEIHIVSHIWPLTFTLYMYNILTFDEIGRANQGQ